MRIKGCGLLGEETPAVAPSHITLQTSGGQLLSFIGRFVTMDMTSGQYIDKRDCFQYVEYFVYVTLGGTRGLDATHSGGPHPARRL